MQKLSISILFSALFLIGISLNAQKLSFPYEPSAENPFGLLNPEANPAIKDFEPMIGLCNCVSQARNADQTWAEPEAMTWRFKYIMNGMAVQDETLKANGVHSGSIRQFNSDSLKWYVHYYTSSTAVATLPAWEGKRAAEGEVVLFKEQKAPNGAEGFFRLTFYDISAESYKWIGEWVDKTESVVFPTWKIDCTKIKQ